MPGVSEIKSKYLQKTWQELKVALKKQIELSSTSSDFNQKYRITKRDFELFNKYAKELTWLSNQETNSIIEHGKTIDEKIVFLFHRFKFTYLPKIRIAPTVPAYVLVEPTSVCNMRCPMCFQTDKTFTTNEFMGKMNYNFYTSIVDECFANGIGAFTLASRGEPTLHPQLIEMLDYARGKFLELKLNTNASRLSAKLSKSILSSVNHVVFSIDSHLKKEYESIRIGGDYNIVLKNVQEFWKIRNSPEFRDRKIRVSISGVKVLSSQNPKAFKSFWERYCDDAYLNPAEERWNTYLNTSHPDLKQSCIYPWERLYIWHDGVVNTCDVDYKSKLSPGNIKDIGGIMKAWKNLEWLRKKHLATERSMVTPCDRCGVSHPTYS